MDQIGNVPSLIGNGIENFASSATKGNADGLEARVEAVGKEFEGVFLSLMLKEMRNTLEGGGFFGEESSDTYGGMFDMFIGQDLAASSPLGISEMLLESYQKNQNATPAVGQANGSGSNEVSVDRQAKTAIQNVSITV